MGRSNMLASHLAPQGGGFEPQRQNHFQVEIYGIEHAAILTLAIDTFALPNETSEPIELRFLNGIVYVAGSVTWDQPTLVLKDLVDQPVAESIRAWRAQVVNPTNLRVGYASTYKKQARVVLYGPDGGAERRWRMIGIWPSAVNWGGTLDYTASAAINQIECTMHFDRALPERITPGTPQGQ